VELDPIPLVWQDDPFPLYAELRDHHPLHHIAERDLWVASRHEDVLALIRTPEHFSSAQGVVPNGFAPEVPTLITLDPPVHTAMRKTVSRAFTPRRMAELEPRIREIARGLVEAMPDEGEVEAFEGFCAPLPFMVMAELLGLDPEDREWLERCGALIVYSTDVPPEAQQEAATELTEHLARTVERRRRAPGDDLISLLLTSSAEGDALSIQDLLALCFLLTLAGTETTTSGLGNALLLLDRYPDARKRIMADPSLTTTAVDEILRFDAPVQGLSRVATDDYERHGTVIPKGARVHLLFGSANRDPRVFERPDEFDITRNPNPHLGFGFGIHHCLGASLARTELRVGVPELLVRFPDYRVVTDRVVRARSDTNRAFVRIPMVV
jgi:cytochrome P450